MCYNQRMNAYPEILYTSLRQGHSNGIRLWLAFRLLDTQGKGNLSPEEYKAITTKGTDKYIVAPRRFWQTINRYNGTLWNCGRNEVIYLKNPAHVAHWLGITELRDDPVKVAEWHLFSSLQTFKAVCYSALVQSLEGRPISRAALAEISGATGNSQRTYERILDIAVSGNIASDNTEWDYDNLADYYWRYGRSIFNLRGKVAWRLSNSYVGKLERAHGKAKRLENNQKLKHQNNDVHVRQGKDLASNYQRRYYHVQPSSIKSHGYVMADNPVLIVDATKPGLLAAVNYWLAF